MKQCPRCSQTYTDETLNFCLNDGELLTMREPTAGAYIDDSPPTMVLDQSRVTDPLHSWQASQPAQVPAQWQGNQPQQFGAFPMAIAEDKTLATVSLCLGIASVTIGWCCSLGLLLGPAALITGYIAKGQIKKDPNRYGGNGLATGGMITGAAFLGIYVLIILIYGLAIIGGGLAGR